MIYTLEFYLSVKNEWKNNICMKMTIFCAKTQLRH